MIQMEKYENALLENETDKNKRLEYEILDKKIFTLKKWKQRYLSFYM